MAGELQGWSFQLEVMPGGVRELASDLFEELDARGCAIVRAPV